MAVAMAHYTVQDGKGKQSVIQVPIPYATTPTNARAFVRAMGAVIGPLVTGKLISAGVTLEVPIGEITGFPSSASTVSDVQEKGFFSFRSAVNSLRRMTIPTILETLFNVGASTINQSHADVAAFITAMEDGVDVSGVGGSGTIQPSDGRGEDLTAIEEAREAWGKYRR